MPLRTLLLILTMFIGLAVHAQVTTAMPAQYAPTKETKELFDKYLRTTDSAEQKINELVALAQSEERYDGDFSKTMPRLQAALILEKYVTRPCDATFDLNVFLGDIFSRFNAQTALFFYRKCITIANSSSVIIPDKKYFLLGAMAGQFSSLHQWDSVLAYCRLAGAEGNTTPRANAAKASTLNNLGFYYAKAGMHDSALAYYNNALVALGDRNTDLVLYCSINDNIAEEGKLKGDFITAIKTYRFNDSVYTTKRRYNRYVINKVRLLSALQKTGAPLAEIQPQLNAGNACINTPGADVKPAEILNFYAFAAGYFFAEKKWDEGIAYNRLYNNLRDSIEKQTTEKLNAITTALLNVQVENFRTEFGAQQLQADRQKAALRNTIIIAAILVLAAMVIIYLLAKYMRQRRKEHQSAQLLAAEQLKIKELEANATLHDLELKKKDLVNVVLYNTQVYENNGKLIEQLNEIMRKGDGMEKSLKSLLIDLKNQSQFGDSSITMQNNIANVNAAFYEKLKEKFPDLTVSDAELCGYIRINLSNKDISVLKNVEPDSIKKGKNRLKKKLGLLPDDDIYHFISKV